MVTKKHTAAPAARTARKPAALPTSAFLANDYFDRLLEKPDRQCLALRLTDLGMKLRPEDEKELVEFGKALQKRLAAFVKSKPQVPDPAPERPENPLIGDTPAETVHRARNVAQYVMFSAPDLANNGSNERASDGLSLVMEAIVDALDAADAQLKVERGALKKSEVRHV